MEYNSLNIIPQYSVCAPLVESLGYALVELKIVPQKNRTSVFVVVTGKTAVRIIGVNDCAKVHRLLLPRLQSILGTEDVYMEVSSPGLERNIKNAAEFALFLGREVRVWDRRIAEWIGGQVINANDKFLVLKLTQGVSSECKVHQNDADKENMSDEQTIPYEEIAKAKFIHL